MDYLTIDNVRLFGIHGHYEHERHVEQEFVVSIRVGFDSYTAGKSDQLTDTIDYDLLLRIVESTIKGASHYLLESLAEDICREILSQTPTKEVTIAIQKPAAWSNGVPGVSITRTSDKK